MAAPPRAPWRPFRHRVEDALRIAVELAFGSIEDHVRAHLSESISIETLAELVELSPFHFSRVFKQATGMTPLQFVTRERMLQAQQLIRETSRTLIEIALEVGYTSPSHFAKVFRRTVSMPPTQFRSAL